MRYFKVQAKFPRTNRGSSIRMPQNSCPSVTNPSNPISSQLIDNEKLCVQRRHFAMGTCFWARKMATPGFGMAIFLCKYSIDVLYTDADVSAGGFSFRLSFLQRSSRYLRSVRKLRRWLLKKKWIILRLRKTSWIKLVNYTHRKTKKEVSFSPISDELYFSNLEIQMFQISSRESNQCCHHVRFCCRIFWHETHATSQYEVRESYCK